MANNDPFGARDTFDTGSGEATLYRLAKLEEAGLTKIAALPYSIRVLLESVLRNCDDYVVTQDDVKALAAWNDSKGTAAVEVPFKPARVVLQDFTGVPCVVDLAAMRSAMQRLGGEPDKINPLVPVDLVIDHSVQVDHFLGDTAIDLNIELEFERNKERYEFLRWGQKAFDNFRVVPPGTGIVHQVNLEYLAKCVFLRDDADGNRVALPDSLVGTDSHTTMIDGLGVVGWGVGGIEAEGVMLGQPIYMLMPEVVGMRTHWQAACRRDGDRPGADGDRNFAEGKSGWQVCRVLRRGRVEHVAGRSGDDRQHEPRVWRHDGFLPGRRRDAHLPSPNRPHRRRSAASRTLLQREQGPVPHRRRRPRRSLRRSWNLISRPSNHRSPAPNDRKTACRYRG